MSQRDYKSTNHLLIDGGGQPQCSAYRKSRRAASMTDDETWVEADHANTINTFDVGDTRTTHAITQTFPIDDGRPVEKHQNGTGIGEDGAPAYTIDRQQRPAVAQTLSVYPEGGNGADIAAAEVDRSPSLTQVKSERGIHVTHTLTSAGHDASEDGTGRGTPIVPHVSPTLTKYNLDSRSPQSEEQQRIVGAVHEAQMSVRRLTPLECERLMGWGTTPCNDKCGCGEPHGWTAPPGIKAPDSKRYAACGDGIVSHVAYWIGCRIQMIEDES